MLDMISRKGIKFFKVYNFEKGNLCFTKSELRASK